MELTQYATIQQRHRHSSNTIDATVLTKQELIEKVECFRSAALDLSRAWEQLHELTLVDNILTTGFPFQQSFEEAVHNFSEWCKGTTQLLRTLL